MYELLIYLGMALGLNAVFFIPAYFYQTDKFTDITYALTFIIIANYAAYQKGQWIIAGLITIWGIRLGGFLLYRVWKKGKDRRFDTFRKDWTKFGKFFILQGIAAWIILIPSILFITNKGTANAIGIGIWAIGFLFETIADYQKWKFRKNPKNKNKFIHTGLWKTSRHPNYFGEITCWIGIYIAVFNGLTGIEKLIGLISPVMITLVIVYMTGLPQLEKTAEKKWGKTKEYTKYKKNTPILIPWIG